VVGNFWESADISPHEVLRYENIQAKRIFFIFFVVSGWPFSQYSMPVYLHEGNLFFRKKTIQRIKDSVGGICLLNFKDGIRTLSIPTFRTKKVKFVLKKDFLLTLTQ
jgi:hypothetical protein